VLRLLLQVGVTFNPQSTYVGTASMDTTARLWDVETGKEVSTLQVIHLLMTFVGSQCTQ